MDGRTAKSTKEGRPSKTTEEPHMNFLLRFLFADTCAGTARGRQGHNETTMLSAPCTLKHQLYPVPQPTSSRRWKIITVLPVERLCRSGSVLPITETAWSSHAASETAAFSFSTSLPPSLPTAALPQGSSPEAGGLSKLEMELAPPLGQSLAASAESVLESAMRPCIACGRRHDGG